jgi:hypothetical protein
MNTISLTPAADKLMTAALRNGGVTLGPKSGRRLLALDLCAIGLLRIEGHRHGVTTLDVTKHAVEVCSPSSVVPTSDHWTSKFTSPCWDHEAWGGTVEEHLEYMGH